MEPIDVYMLYCALKAHFSKSNYDYFKYEGKTRIKRDSFFKRKDRFFFARLSKKYKEYEDIKNYLVANFVSSPDGYVARFNDKVYEDWLYRKQNFYIIFTDEMRPLVSNFQPLFEIKSSNHPKLLQEYLGKRISIETLIILESLVSFVDNWNKEMAGDFIWDDIKKLMNNYKGFLTIDVRKYKIQLLKLIEESN
tara:strand:- start:419 stop:1000 length:582 start_codon:yes stop_codon:yes gene_type:complete